MIAIHAARMYGHKQEFDLNWIKAAFVIAGVSLSVGCSSLQKPAWVFPPMARPLQAEVDQEVQLVRLSQLLSREDLSDDLRAKIYFERGNNYDLLGLRDLARLDFEQSLRFNPMQPEVFNMLGVYFTEVGDYDSAYEAFGSSLELDPDNSYALRNQAIALYYGNRIAVALDEINKFQQHESDDSFAYIWRYFIESKLSQETAEKNLRLAFNEYADGEWSWNLVEMLLSDISDTEIFHRVSQSTRDNTLLAERLTEVYFYLGKRYEMEGHYAEAVSLFNLAIAFNVFEFVEHRYAFLELDNIYQKVKNDSSSSDRQN